MLIIEYNQHYFSSLETLRYSKNEKFSNSILAKIYSKINFVLYINFTPHVPNSLN